MTLPKSFTQTMRNKQAQDERRRQKELQEEKAYDARCQRHAKREKSLLKSKISICKKLFAWKKEFLQTKEGKKLFKKSGNHLWVYGGNWAHELPRWVNGPSNWSRIYLNTNTIEYWSGYKWMPNPSYTFRTPEAMAKHLDSKYLKEFLKEIETGYVYKSILELNRD